MSNAKAIQRISTIIKSVNDLVKMELMQELTAEPNVYVMPEILRINDKKYMKNWCQNVMRVWVLTFKVKNVNAVEMAVFDKQSGNLICKYSENKGVNYEY